LVHTAPGAGLFPYIVEESPVGFLEQSSRFLKPVYAGDTLYPALEVIELVPGRSTGCGDTTLDGVQPAQGAGAGRHAEIFDPATACLKAPGKEGPLRLQKLLSGLAHPDSFTSTQSWREYCHADDRLESLRYVMHYIQSADDMARPAAAIRRNSAVPVRRRTGPGGSVRGRLAWAGCPPQ